VVQLPAGPPHFLPPAQLPPLMENFAARLVGACGGGEGYDVVHADCYLSASPPCGCASAAASRSCSASTIKGRRPSAASPRPPTKSSRSTRASATG
jgi:hypothetical protein